MPKKSSLRIMDDSLRAAPVFALAVLVTVGLAGLNAVMILLMQLQPGFMGMAHFTEISHRTHDLTFGFLFLPAVVGMLAQLRRPSKNIAGMAMALIPWGGLLLAAVLSNAFAQVILINPSRSAAAMTLIAVLLHPTGRDFFRSFNLSRVNGAMLALVAIAAAPLVAFASTNIELQATLTDAHATMGHYGFMAAFAFSVIGVGLLASLRADGWWLPAWVGGLLSAFLGVTSIVYPDVSSSLGPVWALAAIGWGAGFVAAAELQQDAEHRTLLGSLRGLQAPMPIEDTLVKPSSGWANVAGLIAIGLVLLWVVLPFTGVTAGGPIHTPPLQHPPR